MFAAQQWNCLIDVQSIEIDGCLLHSSELMDQM
jgi:hypothetical protein